MVNTTHRGHGGKGSAQKKPMDIGAYGNGTTEYAEVSYINDQLLKYLKWSDASDYSATNVNQNLINIVSNTNSKTSNSSINVSNHLNAFNRSAHGTEVFYYAGDSVGYALAKKLSKAISEALGTFDRGPKATTSLYVVNNTVGTTVLIEWVFVDNASDMAKWRANKDKAILAVAKILGYKGGASNPAPKPTVPRTTPQGPWISENKRVVVADKNAVLYSDFKWKTRLRAKDVGRRQFNAKGKYIHDNGSTYYSLYDDNNVWAGYINKGFTKEIAKKDVIIYKKPEGQWVSENKRVMISDGEATIYSGFDWKVKTKGNKTCNQIFSVTGKYYHMNGFTYYSLYDTKKNWFGYINSGFTSELK